MTQGCNWFRRMAATALMGFGLANANPLPAPTVDYSATRIIESTPGPFVSKIFVSEGKERSETTVGANRMVTIIRPDKKLAWILMPASKTYQEVDLEMAAPHSHAQLFPEGDFKKVSEETIDGLTTTQYQVLLNDKTKGGRLWITGEGIALKAEKPADETTGQPAMTVKLQELRIGKQDASLFELPSGYEKFVK